MFLGSYAFDGAPEALLQGYDRLVAAFPPGALVFHVCIAREDGITILDACPSRAVFDNFSTSPEFTAAVAAAGLPAPTVEPLGDVHNTVVAGAR